MAEYLIQEETLTGLADAIRAVSSDTTMRSPEEMAAYITDYLVKPTATLGAQTITPTTSAQTIAAGSYLKGATTIGAIPSDYVKPTVTKAAATITPGTSNQTIAAGTYLTGTQTIAGDANLAAANIKKGVNIFGKTGTLSGIWGDPSKCVSFSAVASGSFTTASTNTSAQTITHNIGVVPKMIWITSNSTATYSHCLGNSFVWLPGTSDVVMYNQYSYNSYAAAAFYGRDAGIRMVYDSSYGFTSLTPSSFTATSPEFADDQYVFPRGENQIRATISTFTIHAALCAYTTYKWLVMG